MFPPSRHAALIDQWIQEDLLPFLPAEGEDAVAQVYFC